MAIQPMALQVQNPQINAVQDFQTGQANALNAKAGEMNQEAAALQQLAEAGYGVLDHNLDGPINQQRLDQMLGLMGANPLVDKIKANPELIRTITKGSLAILAVQNDQAKATLEKQKLEQELNAPAEVNGQLVDKKTLQVVGDYRTPPAAPQPTDDQREYQQAIDQGYKGTFMDYMREIKKAGAAQTNITNNTGGTDSFYENLDKNLAGQTAALMDAGTTARANAIRISQLKEYLKTAPQGAEGAFTQLAGSIGIPMDGVDEVQAAQAIINQLVPQQRPPGAGTMSDADLELYKKSLPAIINQKGGNERIIQLAEAINTYTIAQSDIANRVANREISPAEGRKLQAQVPNPLEGFSATEGGGDSSTNGNSDGPKEYVTSNGITYSY